MNLAQTDPYYIPQASKDGRLALRKGFGPLSSGTKVRFVSSDPNWNEVTVEAEITVMNWKRDTERVKHQVTVTKDDLVIRRRAV